MNKLSRRQLLVLLANSALLGVLPACQPSSKNFRLARHKWPGYEFIYLAALNKKFDTQTIQLHETHSGTESIKALSSKQVDAAMLTLDEVLRARAQGIALTAVLVVDVSAGADVILIKPPKPELQAETLRGMRIGVEQGALGALMLSQFLKKIGMQHHEIRQVSLTPEQQELAWKQDEVDALICYSPVSARVERAGGINIFDSRSLPNMIVDVLAVRQDMLHSHATSIQQIVAAHFAMLTQLTQNPKAIITPMATHLGESNTELQADLAVLSLPNLEQNKALLSGSTPPLLYSAKVLVEVMKNAGLLLKEDNLQDLLSAEFL